MNIKFLLVVVGILTVFLVGCSAETPGKIIANSASITPANTSDSTIKSELDDLKPISTPQPTISIQRTEVLWSDYDPELQQNIDLFAANQDCQGLQSYFGLITATEQSMIARSGHGNEALEKYLKEAISISGCG